MDIKIILMCGISSGFGFIFGIFFVGIIFGLEVVVFGIMNYISLIFCFFLVFIGNFVIELFNVYYVYYFIL